MRFVFNILMFFIGCTYVHSQEWISSGVEAKPYTRWWWMGSAVDSAGLDRNLRKYADAGIGGVEITPIYGVKGNEANEIPYLSSRWMSMLSHTENVCTSLGMETEMATGTGWPFGGPHIDIEDAAAMALFQRYDVQRADSSIDISCRDDKQKSFASLSRVMAYRYEMVSGKRSYSDVLNLTDKVASGKLPLNILPEGRWDLVVLYCGRTLQMVKRAAVGGEGYVIDHFSRKSVKKYLDRFDSAFVKSAVKFPRTFFNDSYEAYGADWTPDFLSEFESRRGYKLENFFPDFISDDSERTDVGKRIVSDYRQTMGELLLENFTSQWTDWAHFHGAVTRNQAHGSPANLIDIYGAVDIPECEGFGLSDFGISGLRRDDGFTRKNDSDISMLKYASSASHISGKKFTSSETFTWLTEHFRTSLSQCKPDLDLMFVSGVNHVVFHGTCYSPSDAQWPGWHFYASTDMSPYNSIWRDMPAFSKYIERCQAFLQWGKPDNDFLVYLPYYDMIYEQPGRQVLFDIHKMALRAPEFINAVKSIINNGFDADYISDSYLLNTSFSSGKLRTSGGASYSAVIVPGVRFMPCKVFEHLLALARQGATVIFMDVLPSSVPGYAQLQSRQARMDSVAASLMRNVSVDFSSTTVSEYGNGNIVCSSSYKDALCYASAKRELMRSEYGMQCIRRSNSNGYHYFISNLQGRDIDGWIPLGVDASEVVAYDPMNGKIGRIMLKKENGKTKVYMQLRSGESLILRTFVNKPSDTIPDWQCLRLNSAESIDLNNDWRMRFVESAPDASGKTYSFDVLRSWTELEDTVCRVLMGTGLYTKTFNISDVEKYADWVLDLGDVRESARVRINGHECGTLFAVPYTMRVGQYLRDGENTVEVEVTNLPANRISMLDRQGVEWRRFKDINVVDLNYKPASYADWTSVPSGLLGGVKLTPADAVLPDEVED